MCYILPKKYSLISFINIVAILVLSITSCKIQSKAEFDPTSYQGLWSGWGNRMGKQKEYLLIQQLGNGYLVLYAYEGGVVRRGIGHAVSNKFLVTFSDSCQWELEQEQIGELRAMLTQDHHDHDHDENMHTHGDEQDGSSFVFYRPLESELTDLLIRQEY